MYSSKYLSNYLLLLLLLLLLLTNNYKTIAMSRMRNYRGPLDDKRGLSLAAIKEEVQDMGYASIDAIPTKVSQLENDSKYITKEQAPVLSVNNQTGSVNLKLFSGNYSDLVGLPTLFKATDQAIQKVKYYEVTTNSSGSWMLDISNEGFNSVNHVSVQAVSSGSLLSGIRQASINTYSSASRVFNGLAASLGGVISLSPSTVVKIRVEGT